MGIRNNEGGHLPVTDKQLQALLNVQAGKVRVVQASKDKPRTVYGMSRRMYRKLRTRGLITNQRKPSRFIYSAHVVLTHKARPAAWASELAKIKDN